MSERLSWLHKGDIRVVVGDESYRRGLEYVRQGRVESFEFVDETVYGLVRGSRRYPYDVEINKEPGGKRFYGECSCPLRFDCKHVAALALTVVAEAETPLAVSRWERQLAATLPPNPANGASQRPLGLQFEPVHSRYGRPIPRLRLRPVTTGRRGDWVRTGVGWRELEYSWNGEFARHPAREPLLALHNAMRSATVDGRYNSGELPLFLDAAGSSVWPRLDELIAAQVPLVFGKNGRVEVISEPLTPQLDLSRESPTGSITMQVAILGDSKPDSDAVPLGDPPIGLVAVFEEGRSSHLRLWRFDRRPDAVSVGILNEGEVVEIPAADADRFFSTYLPQLRRIAAPASLDGSVVLPDPIEPRLLLEMWHQDGHHCSLTWFFRYVVEDQDSRFPIGRFTNDEIRDQNAEHALLSSLDLDIPAFGALTKVHGRRRDLLPEQTFTGMDTATLLHDTVPLLREMDIDIVEHGEPLDYRPAASEPVVALSVTDSKDRDWFDLEVTVKVDGFTVPFGLLFTALATSRPLLLSNGVYVDVDRPQFHQLKALIKQARTLEDPQARGLRINQVNAGLWDELCGLGVVESQSETWRAAVAGMLDLDALPRPAPSPRLLAELRPYQLTGYHWMSFLSDSHLGGILADDMGLGKTVQALAMLQRAADAGASAPTLVIAPTSVVSNWATEAARFTPDLSVATVTETALRRGKSLRSIAAGAQIVVTSYTLLRMDYEEYDQIAWGIVLLDEAQAVKNHRGKTYQCVRRLRADTKFAITGTPMENNLMELWALLSIVAPGLFPDPEQFTVDYRQPIEKESDRDALATLRQRIRPLMLRRTKELVARDLPEKQEQVMRIDLHPRHRKVYSTYLQRERQKLLRLLDDLHRNRFQILQALTKLRQLALSPSLVDPDSAGVPSAKIDFLVEQLIEISAEGHRALVFSQFTRFLTQVRERLTAEGITYEYLDGRTRNRPAKIDAFKNGDSAAFLISLKAGGVGLNLVEADYCFVLDPWWNPASEAQAVDRAHRIGQTRPVMVYRLIAKDTVEDKVLQLQQAKRELFAKVMGDDGALNGGLTAQDLRNLLG